MPGGLPSAPGSGPDNPERAGEAGALSALARILAGIDALSRASGYVAAVLVLGIAALIIAEIFCRTALNVSLSFAWEYAAYFFAVLDLPRRGVRAADGRVRESDAALAERSAPAGVLARRRRHGGWHDDRWVPRVGLSPPSPRGRG